MFRKEVNENSPMRVFESSTTGGLGKGHVGVVVARPGVGKTALLVQIALDNLLRDRKVLHICHEHGVDRVRSYYDELFADLAISHQLEQTQMVRLEMERNRLIYSHLPGDSDSPASSRGGKSSITKIDQTVTFAREIAHFDADVVIIDGFDLENCADDAIDELKKLATASDSEVWLSATSEKRVEGDHEATPSQELMPAPARRFFESLGVVVLLQPEADTVRLRLLKDHDSVDLSALNLRLDPVTMRVIDEDLPPRSRPPKDPNQFQLYAGGTKGAETFFGECAERWGMRETHFSFEGHPFRERERGLRVLPEDELRKGDFSLVYASHRLGRPLTQIPNIKRILQTVWHQINAASQVFVIGTIEDSGTVRGGTGWGAELARLWSKPLWVFDQAKGHWYRWDAAKWVEDDGPKIQAKSFAGIGTMRLTQEGRTAIERLFVRSFGPADG